MLFERFHLFVASVSLSESPLRGEAVGVQIVQAQEGFAGVPESGVSGAMTDKRVHVVLRYRSNTVAKRLRTPVGHHQKVKRVSSRSLVRALSTTSLMSYCSASFCVSYRNSELREWLGHCQPPTHPRVRLQATHGTLQLGALPKAVPRSPLPQLQLYG